MFRSVVIALVWAAGGMSGALAAEPLWIDRPAAQPWLPALTSAAQQSDLPLALIAELIGIESGYRNIHNPHSSAAGFGQQIAHNRTMARHKLHPMRPADSIMGAALQFREELDRTHSLAGAARAYGTTAGLTPARQKAIIARLETASRRL